MYIVYFIMTIAILIYLAFDSKEYRWQLNKVFKAFPASKHDLHFFSSALNTKWHSNQA